MRIVTTINLPANGVEYTRGYLDASEDLLGVYESNSAVYRNTGAIENPFQPEATQLKITLRKASAETAEIAYTFDHQPAAFYTATCLPNLLMLVAVTDRGVITASLRGSGTN